MPNPALKLMPLIRSVQRWPVALHVRVLHPRGTRFCCSTTSESPGPPLAILRSVPSRSLAGIFALPLPALTKDREQPLTTMKHNLFEQQLGTLRIKKMNNGRQKKTKKAWSLPNHDWKIAQIEGPTTKFQRNFKRWFRHWHHFCMPDFDSQSCSSVSSYLDIL